MQLDYLDFDFSDEETGRGSFDAMASVTATRLPALLAEVATVLNWSVAAFGPCETRAAQDDGAEWDYDLQAVAEPGAPLEAAFDESRGEVVLAPTGPVTRITLTLTLGGSLAFCAAFREAFGIGG